MRNAARVSVGKEPDTSVHATASSCTVCLRKADACRQALHTQLLSGSMPLKAVLRGFRRGACVAAHQRAVS